MKKYVPVLLVMIIGAFLAVGLTQILHIKIEAPDWWAQIVLVAYFVACGGIINSASPRCGE